MNKKRNSALAGNHRPQVDVEHTIARRNPLIALSDDQRGQIGISQEGQQLQRPAEHYLRCSCRCSHLDGGRRRHGHLDRGRSRRLHNSRCDVRECGGQAFDRRVLVDVFDRHRRQIRPLSNPGAEPGHHHRVRTKIIEEVAVHRHPLDLHDISEHVGEDPLDGHRRGVRKCRGQASDRTVLVDVLDRHRRQIRPLPNPGTEPGHHHRVRTKIIEEVAVHRHPLDLHDISEHVGEDPLDGHRRGVRKCRGQASDRTVLVDVLDRHRRQIRPLPNPGTEPGHHHRVRTKIIEEVAVHRHPLDLHDLSQHLGEGALGARLRASAPGLRSGRISRHLGEGALGARLRESAPGRVAGESAGTSAKVLSVLDSGRARLACVVGESARATVKAPRASGTL